MRIAFIVIIISMFQYSYTQESSENKLNRKEKRDKEFAEFKEIIDGRLFVFKARSAHPQGGQRIDLTTHNSFLEIQNDSAHANLSYFGRAYNVPYGGGDGGIKFNGLMEDYILKVVEKKRKYEISFKVKENNDTFNCTLSISGSGSASLNVTSMNRAFISYSGNVEEIKPRE